jgi:hypothetical protein
VATVTTYFTYWLVVALLFLGFYIYEKFYAKNEIPSDLEISIEKPVLDNSVGSSMTEVHAIGASPNEA